MITLTGIVFTIGLVMVQVSAIAYSPRLVLLLARDPRLVHSLGVFIATFTYSSAVRPERSTDKELRLDQRCPVRVKLKRTQLEQMSSGIPPKVDIALCSCHVRNLPATDSCTRANSATIRLAPLARPPYGTDQARWKTRLTATLRIRPGALSLAGQQRQRFSASYTRQAQHAPTSVVTGNQLACA
jgi:hypothetical protein